MRRALLGITVAAVAACPTLDPPPTPFAGSSTQGSFSVTFRWATAKPPYDPTIFALGRVMDVSDPQSPTTLRTSGPFPYDEHNDPPNFRFNDVTNGHHRVVEVTYRRGSTESAPVLYYGLSQEFSLWAGRHTRVEVDVNVAPTPRLQPAHGGRVAPISIRPTGDDGFVKDRAVGLVLVTDTAVQAHLSNVLGFPSAHTVQQDLASLAPANDPVPAGYHAYELGGWDLEAGLTQRCDDQDACERTVYVRFTDAHGFPSDIASASVVLDTRLPTAPLIQVTSPVSRGGRLVYAVNVSEPLGGPVAEPVLTVRNGAGVVVPAILVAPTRNTATSFTYAPAHVEDGTYSVTLELTDRAGNTSGVLPVAGFVVDSVEPGTADTVFGGADHARAGTVSRVELTSSEPVRLPDVHMAITGHPTVPFDLVSSSASGSGTRYVFSHVVSETDAQGLGQVVVALEDLAGNRGGPWVFGTMVVDLTKPSLTPADVTVTPSRVGIGQFLVIQAHSNELLSRADPATVDSPVGLQFDEPVVSGRSVIWTHQVVANEVSAVTPVGVTLTVYDLAGNAQVLVLPHAADIDAVAPAVSVVGVAPARISKTGNLTVRLEATKDLAAGQPTAWVGGRLMDCGPHPEEHRHHLCTYAMTGEEIATGTEAAQVILVHAEDSAGNAGTAGGSVVFDFRDPEVASAAVGYLPGTENPLGLVTAATVGTTIQIAVTPDEPLDVLTTPTLTLMLGPHQLAQDLQAATSSANAVTFQVLVAGLVPDGDYVPRVTWRDVAGNLNNSATFATPVRVKTSPPHLAIKHQQVTFVRSAWGNAAAEVLGSYRIPPGPYFALAGADTLAEDPSLPADTFTLDTGSPRLVRLWSDVDKTTPLATLVPRGDGKWVRKALPYLDSVTIYATGLDAAGNESDVQKIVNVEWVATPSPTSQGPSPHRAQLVPRVTNTLAQTWAVPATHGTAAAGLDGVSLVADTTAAWRPLDLGAAPKARVSMATAYDAGRQRVVLFGGRDPDGFSAETWEWAGAEWTSRHPEGPRPTGRVGHAMAYDTVRGQVVLVGGVSASLHHDTWSWDGTTWLDRTPVGDKPTARQAHAMAFDLQRETTVLFGGFDGELRNDTWRWDGTAWTRLEPVGGLPTPRLGHAMAYDVARRRVVLFGGHDGAPCQDTWEWDGLAWQEVAFAGTGPGPRAGHGLAYDTARRRVVLFGGDEGTTQHDTWEWDGVAWTHVVVGGGNPSPRRGLGMAYDVERARTVLFGGENTVLLQDTWTWDGVAWTNRTAPGLATPGVRWSHAMASDTLRGRVVMFGGQGLDSTGRDTWEWDGVAWSERSPVTGNPNSRHQTTLAFDSGRGRTVLFGGMKWSEFGWWGDTWEWDGDTWVNLTPASGTSPAPRQDSATAYDAARARVVLFGGSAGSSFRDTWEWDGHGWTERTPTGDVPTARWGHAMAYHGGRQRVVLFGGFDVARQQDTWEWDGTSWALRNVPGAKPPPRNYHAMAYDEERGVVVLLGGLGGSGMGQMLLDTWEWNGATWVERFPTSGPVKERYQHAMAYSPVSRRVVTFGGLHGIRNVLQAWSGTDWVPEVPAPVRPPARALAVMATDTARGRVVLFGGVFSIQNVRFFDDTWEWDGTAWQQQGMGRRGPDARRHTAMAYDAARARTVLFGGETDTALAQDTWTWDGTAWSLQPVTGPTPSVRFGHAVAYDAVRERVVLFAGASPTILSDTWEWDGTSWEERTPSGARPSLRYLHAMAYDARQGRVVMFGGTSTNSMQDTWEWDGVSWEERVPRGGKPSARMGHAMTYDPGRHRVVLTGGYDVSLLQDSWEWDGDQWVETTLPGEKPAARYLGAMASDPTESTVLFFGGVGSTYFQDTWAYQVEPTQQSAVEFDVMTGGRGFTASSVQGLRVRAHCGGEYGAGGTGAALHGWRSGDPDVVAGDWVQLDANDVVAGDTQPVLAVPPSSLLGWRAASADEARRFMVERDALMAFQCRPAGQAGEDGASVALDFIEVRVRYVAP
jgi:hypothetical protein